MSVISPPNQTDTRSALADWLELRTLMDTRGVSTRAVLLNVLDILEDEAGGPDSIDSETGGVLDEAILEGARYRFVDITFDELQYRSKLLGVSYPFEVDAIRQRLVRRSDDHAAHVGQVVYLFCLLASAIRERRLASTTALCQAEQGIADVFQICACLAAGGYLHGDVSSFGFPRASGTGFLAALRETFARFGVGQLRNSHDIPDGLPTSIKDGGIDVIAWRDHPDGMPGKLYLIGQCASGLHWREKSVVEYIPQLHGSWFTHLPAFHSTPALFIPFPFHHDIPERSGSYLDAVKNRFWHDESRFGIIFDRLRISHFSNACMSFAEDHRQRLDGWSRFDQVVCWVNSTRQKAGLVHA